MSAYDCANNSTSHNNNKPNNYNENTTNYNNNLSSTSNNKLINKSLIAHIANLPGFDSSKARIVKQSCYSSGPNTSNTSYNNSQVGTPILPTAAETFLPWRRDRSYQAFGRFLVPFLMLLFLFCFTLNCSNYFLYTF